ncbi:Rho GTPase-activating protein 11A [Dirofilaria immitis]
MQYETDRIIDFIWTTEIFSGTNFLHIIFMDKYLDGLRSMRLYRQANSLPTTSGSYQFTLENVASYTMELDVGDRRGFSTFTLRGVPVFLVDAFNFLRLNGLDASGIFRKEGNISRLKSFSMQTFFGNVVLPQDCTTHDVCSLIKRFFRELKTPLFAQMQTKLLDTASVYHGTQRIDKLLEAIRMLPAEHQATLTFLMRQLKYFGDRHEGHQMTVENIARVFAPSLFRDDPPPAPNKKKGGSQEDLISNVRNENELRIAIIVDLIDNAHKIGVPHDYYLASRRPSDVSQKIFKGRFMGYVGVRSVSAKPSSRNAASTALVIQKTGTRKEKTLEKQPSEKQYKGKISRERRSSSTVRDFFSNISNKVLRRGLSPASSGRRRCSAGDVINEESLKENMSELDVAAHKFCVRKCIDTCNIVQHTPRVKLENEKFPAENNDSSMKSCITSPSSIVFSPQKINGKRLLGTNIRIPSTRTDGTESLSTKNSKHRSRRESPRKSNATNSKNKTTEKYKVIRELKEANVMPASPAFEPIEMTTKNIGEAFLKHISSDEKLEVSKIIKRNSSKKLLQPVKIADSSQSFVEGYSADKIISRIHRRHTAPVKASTLLKRNQPNSVTTGLKTPQSLVREIHSATLNLKIKGMDEDLVLEKKKRRSESLSGDSDDNLKVSVDDGLSCTMRGMQFFSAEALLEQKHVESRQRRVKRQKRREEVSGSVQAISVQSTTESTPITSHLNDVSNEINHLEKDRKVVSKLLKNEKNVFLFSDITKKDHDLDLESTKASLPSFPPPTDNSSLSVVPFKIKENRTELSSSPDIPKYSLYSLANTNVQLPVFNAPSSAVKAVFNKTLRVKSEKHVSKQNVNSVHGSKNAGENIIEDSDRLDDFREDFSKSDAIKIQLLNAKNEDDIVAGPAYMPSGSRPSVLSIKSNNRGMVRQRINHFARLGTPKNILEQKLSSPPASHSLRPIVGRNVPSPSREIVMRRAKKFEALATSVGLGAWKNFRPATRNRLAKIQRQNNPKIPRRLSGEMRVIRCSQARLNKSLEKLAVDFSNRGLMRSSSHSGCDKLRLLSANNGLEKQQQNAGQSLVRASYHDDFKYMNPSIMLPSANLKMIPEIKHDT